MSGKNMIEMIEEVLVNYWHFDHGSAVTLAVVYVIFNRNSSRLVNYMDDPKEFAKQVNRTIVLDGIKHTREILEGFEKGIPPI